MSVSEGTDLPLVSVITPCYNAGPFVAETIESVRAQMYPHIEHIVVDDCSTDGSWEVLQRYSDQLTAVRLEQNGGGSQARNHGAARARGQFLMFLDADDVLASDTIEALVETARENPEKITFCPWKRLRQVQGRWVEQPGEVPLPEPGADPLKGWLEGIWVPTCSILWPREVYQRTGGWDEQITLNDDGDIMMRALAGGARLAAAMRGESYYRAHGYTRISVSGSGFTEKRLQSSLCALEKLVAQLERLGKLQSYTSSVGVAYHRLALAAFQQSQLEFARECRALGEMYGGRRVISRTFLGRLLSLLVGVERKEWLATELSRYGIGTQQRRNSMQLRTIHMNQNLARAVETDELANLAARAGSRDR